MKSKVLFAAFIAAVGFTGACSSTGLTVSSHLTNVQLASPNYTIVATNIAGEASSRAILGVSFGVGFGSSQLALIPLDKNRLLYGSALKNLWDNFESKHGAVSGRKLALVNLRYDSDALNLLLYTKVSTAVVADVIEFE